MAPDIDEDRDDWSKHGFVPERRTPAESLPPALGPRMAGGSRGPEVTSEPDPLEGTTDPRTGRIRTGLDGKIRFWPTADPENPVRVYPIDATDLVQRGFGTIAKPEPSAKAKEGGAPATKRRATA